MEEKYFEEAAIEARRATCRRAKCGSVIVLDGQVVGRGFNSPPGDKEERRTCDYDYSKEQEKPKSDRTCCMHAEWRAIIDALRNKGDIKGGTLYFTRVDDEGEIQKSGEPYCTVCSRFALDVGLRGFALNHESGVRIYDTEEYDRLSYEFHSRR